MSYLPGTVSPLAANGKSAVPDPMANGTLDAPQGVTYKDAGSGKLEALDANGNSLGMVYKDYAGAITDWLMAHPEYNKINQTGFAPDYLANVDPSDANAVAEAQAQQKAFEDSLQARDASQTKQAVDYMIGNYLWDGARQANAYAALTDANGLPAARNYYGGSGENYIGLLDRLHRDTGDGARTVSGENSLIGSKPVFDKSTGKIIGYQQTTNDPYHEDHSGKAWAFNSDVSQQYDPSLNAKDGKYFVSSDKAKDTAGYTTGSNWKNVHFDRSGGSPILGALGTLLSFTPLAPVGVLLSGVNAIASGSPLGLASAALGAGGGMDAIGKGVGDTLGVSSNVGKAIAGGAMSTVGALGSGASAGKAIGNGLLTAGAGLVGNQVGEMTGSNLAGGVANGLTKAVGNGLLNSTSESDSGGTTQAAPESATYSTNATNYMPGTVGKMIWRN